MAAVLKRQAHIRWVASMVVGAIALSAHLLDYFVTLAISPTLELEANPLWRIAIAGLGLPYAKAYAFTGKVLLSVLSAEFFAWYLAVRQRPEPDGEAVSGASFLSIRRPRFARMTPFFAFSFALFGGYFFYITAYNWLGYLESPWYPRLPSPPLAIALYFAGVGVAYWSVRFRAEHFGERFQQVTPEALPLAERMVKELPETDGKRNV